MSSGNPSSTVFAVELLRFGQSAEAHGDLRAALTLYEQALAAFRALPGDDVETRRLHGVAWMNRGNALQKIGDAPSRESAVRAYDAAIALFASLPIGEMPAHRNHLGAAWLNRGHTLLAAADVAPAIASFEQACLHLEKLPLEPFSDATATYRLNLTGAQTNLAHTLLGSSSVRGAKLARAALALLAPVERTDAAFAEMSLRARRALVTALGELLVGKADFAAFASEASDVIDDGLALARGWEQHGARLRPLALRLFRLGAQLYRVHQPHFLGEFVLENLATDAFGGDAEFHAIGREALASALGDLQRPQLHVAGRPETERAIATARSLRTAQDKLSTLPPPS